MSNLSLEQFQQQVSELLLRHRSLLDVMTKFGQTGASVNRAISKAVTECGCVELNAHKQRFEGELDLEQVKLKMEHHMNGGLCEHCKDALRAELGKNLFYMSALSNLLDIRLEEVIEQESKKCSTLGVFNMT
jgi:NTP pyrophosphatase (non-canonical NTP hydrolase)